MCKRSTLMSASILEYNRNLTEATLPHIVFIVSWRFYGVLVTCQQEQKDLSLTTHVGCESAITEGVWDNRKFLPVQVGQTCLFILNWAHVVLVELGGNGWLSVCVLWLLFFFFFVNTINICNPLHVPGALVHLWVHIIKPLVQVITLTYFFTKTWQDKSDCIFICLWKIWILNETYN